MARLAENGALQYAVANHANADKRQALAGYMQGVCKDAGAIPPKPLNRLTAKGRILWAHWQSIVEPVE